MTIRHPSRIYRGFGYLPSFLPAVPRHGSLAHHPFNDYRDVVALSVALPLLLAVEVTVVTYYRSSVPL